MNANTIVRVGHIRIIIIMIFDYLSIISPARGRDIGLIRISPPFVFNQYVQPVALPAPGAELKG